MDTDEAASDPHASVELGHASLPSPPLSLPLPAMDIPPADPVEGPSVLSPPPSQDTVVSAVAGPSAQSQWEALFDSDSELSTPPSSPAPTSSSSSDDDGSSRPAARKRKKYIRKPKVVGPAARKVFLAEGLYSHVGSAAASSSTLPPASDEPELVRPERKKPKRRSFWDYETVLPDGTVVDGKLDLVKPAEPSGDATVGEGLTANVVPTVKDEDTEGSFGARSRTRGRASLPAPLPASASTSTLSASPSADASAPSPSASSATPSLPLPVPSPAAIFSAGTRLRPRASLPSPIYLATPSASVTPRRVKKPEVPFTFPLPIQDGLGLLIGDRDFDLPYDIRWEHENDAIVTRKEDRRAPPKFKMLAKNTFPERGRDMDPSGPAVCSCVLPSDPDETGCGEKCMNRMMQYLCHPKTCPCGDRCSNKSLYKRQGPQTKVFWTGNRGFGLQALEDILEGTFVIDYRGEIIEISTYYTRILTTYASRGDFYALEYGEGEVIDACMKGNEARFVNHGCSPNLEVRKYTTLGEGVEEYEVGLWASRDIEAGEELFYDYNFDSFSNRPSKLPAGASPTKSTAATQEGNGRQRCTCGAEGCSGWIGGKKVAAVVEPKGVGEAKKPSGAARKKGKGKDAKKKSGGAKRRR